MAIMTKRGARDYLLAKGYRLDLINNMGDLRLHVTRPGFDGFTELEVAAVNYMAKEFDVDEVWAGDDLATDAMLWEAAGFRRVRQPSEGVPSW